VSTVLELLAIEKSFGGVRALAGATLTARRGEIVGLCGENGAGKSTLLKVLSGVHPYGSYRGVVRVLGREVRLVGPADAQRAGVAMVHQELTLAPNMTVAECLMLGREPRHFGLIDDNALLAQARALLTRYGFANEINASAEVSTLGIGLQQIVEIVRALSYETAVLVLDEPTAALTSNESARLLTWLRDLRTAGTTAIYVSHRLDEVFALADRVTVLRDGATVFDAPIKNTTVDVVVSAMVGRALASGPSRSHRADANTPLLHGDSPPLLEVENLRMAHVGGGGRVPVDNISLRVRRGEIVAIAGAMGSGRTALLSTLFGDARGDVSGSMRIDGVPVFPKSPKDAIALGIALVPEDRKGTGLILGRSVAENLALPSLGVHHGTRAMFGFVDSEREECDAQVRIRELRVRGVSSTVVSNLSGGNQQKVVLGKWLLRKPRVLLLDEPTRGVDIGAREEIYALLEAYAANGGAVLCASSDLHEIVRIAHRIIVLCRGAIAGEIDGRDASRDAIVALSTGATQSQSHSHMGLS
jgi:D-xylose transport system ATP-binding protein